MNDRDYVITMGKVLPLGVDPMGIDGLFILKVSPMHQGPGAELRDLYQLRFSDRLSGSTLIMHVHTAVDEAACWKLGFALRDIVTHLRQPVGDFNPMPAPAFPPL